MEKHGNTFWMFSDFVAGKHREPKPMVEIPRERLFDHLSPVCSPQGSLAEFNRSSTRVLGRWVGVRLLLIGGLFRRDSSKRLGHVGKIQALLPRHFFLDRSQKVSTSSYDLRRCGDLQEASCRGVEARANLHVGLRWWLGDETWDGTWLDLAIDLFGLV